MPTVKPIQDVMRELKGQALGGAKVPHGFSNPVLHRTTDGYVIAHFIYTYTRKQWEDRLVPRPSVWLLADPVTGALIREIPCKTLDFTDRPADSLCRLGLPEGAAPTKETFDALFRRFDLVRQRYADTGILDTPTYRAYLRELLRQVPESFRPYYLDLSAIR